VGCTPESTRFFLAISEPAALGSLVAASGTAAAEVVRIIPGLRETVWAAFAVTLDEKALALDTQPRRTSVIL